MVIGYAAAPPPTDAYARPPLIRLGFFIELPFDARLPLQAAWNTIELTEPPVPGWDDFDVQRYLGFPPVAARGVHPTTTLYFRRRTRSLDPPLRAEQAAFGDEFHDLLGTSRFRRLRLRWIINDRVVQRRHVPKESRTVVLAQRISSPPTIPLTNVWMIGEFEKALKVLNSHLFALGWVSGDTAIGPVQPMELPPIVFGFQVDLRDVLARRGSRRRVRPMPFVFMTPAEHPREADAFDQQTVEQAHEVVEALDQNPPFIPAGEMLYAAQRSFAKGRLAQAVLEAGTSAELLINAAVREVGPLRGDDATRVRNVLDGPFANRVRDHFARLLDFSRDLEDEADELGQWWSAGYLLRNRVSHDGYAPSADEAWRAIEAAHALVGAVGVRLQRNPVTRRRLYLLPSLRSSPDDEPIASDE